MQAQAQVQAQVQAQAQAALRRPGHLASNAGMEPLHRIEQRLTDLEVKACFTEDLADDLNRLVARQQDQIDALLREIGRLRQQRSDAEPEDFLSLRDDLPPHY